ncbi:MAG TPA: OmpA family protein [Puia sp.]|nr:OmpA family protein [Puia sp.]
MNTKLTGVKTYMAIAGLTVCLAVVATPGLGQGFGIEFDGGLQGMQYRLNGRQMMPLPGGSAGVTYGFRLGSRINLRTGLLGGVYRTQATLKDGTSYTYGQVDDAGSAFAYNVQVTGYRETQQFLAACVPLILEYHTGGQGIQWYIAGGGKAVMPFNGSVRVSARQLSLTGYYPDYNVDVSNLPRHGFGTVNGWNSQTAARLKPSAVLTAATGLGFRLSRGVVLYAGVYIDYGLTDLREKSDSLPLVTYSPGGIDRVRANSVMNMQNAGPLKLFSAGLQVRLGFGGGQAKAAASAKSRKKAAEAKAAAQTQAAGGYQPAALVPTPSEKKDRAPGAKDSAREERVHQESVTPLPGKTEPLVATSADINDSEAAIIERPVVFGTIGETVIPEMQRPHLDSVVSLLKDYPQLRVSIEGHFCDSVAENENRHVAEARAKAVARYFESKGISRSRMQLGFARVSDPVLSYDPAANYRNRRVAITLQ